jgi:ABC-type transport system involved in multi-copper enzyme maturation permease subunit
MQVALIARNTFRESVRDRVLYNLILFALLMIGCSLFIGELAIGGEQKIIVDFGLSFMRFFGALIAIFIGIQLVYKEIERRTIFALLARPIGRGEFIVGKFAGLGLTLAVNSSILLVGLLVTLALIESGISALTVPVLAAAYLIFLELLIVTAIALLFSTLSSPGLTAVLTVLVYVVGHFTTDFKLMADATEAVGLSTLLHVLYYLLPNLTNFNRIASAAYGEAVPPSYLAQTTLYAAVYCGALLSLAVVSFVKRDFK